ncbi:hypothetical protein BD410DRAFT_842201 [Rickenella mellea]|uniref:Uncharacterized protein n=1 Tax=Rickenella mellea TaxID=50990 RepID=A0A4Y7PW51_9AGAM|nr:hypothetical protein BD410DRAFT_842201 [Rickenella mellea]
MGAPPGAPGAIDGTPRTRTNALALFTLLRERRGTGREELTPRVVLAALAMHTPMPVAMPMQAGVGLAQGVALLTVFRNIQFHTITTPQDFHPQVELHWDETSPSRQLIPGTSRRCSRTSPCTYRARYWSIREEDVLLSLQLLAYLSKFPHVRQAFYKLRTSFHPATAQLPRSQPFGAAVPRVALALAVGATGAASTDPLNKYSGFFYPFTARGQEQGLKAAVTTTMDPNSGDTPGCLQPRRSTKAR